MTNATLYLAIAALGVDVGYQPTKDGGMQYVVHIDASTLAAMKAGEPIDALIPAEVRNLPPGRIRFVIDTAPVPKRKPATTFDPSSAPGRSGLDGLGPATSASFAGALGSPADGSTGSTIPLRPASQFDDSAAAGTRPSLPGGTDPLGPTAGTPRHHRGDVPLNTPDVPVRSPDAMGSGTAASVPLVPAGASGGMPGGTPFPTNPLNGPTNGPINGINGLGSNAPGNIPLTSGPPAGPMNGAPLGGGPNDGGLSGPGLPGPTSNSPVGGPVGGTGPVNAPPPYLGSGNGATPQVFGAPSPNYSLSGMGNPGGYAPTSAGFPATGNNGPSPVGYGNPGYGQAGGPATNPNNAGPNPNNMGPNAAGQGPVVDGSDPSRSNPAGPLANWAAERPDELPGAKPDEPSRVWILYCLAMGGLLFSNGYTAYMFWDARQRYLNMIGRVFAVVPGEAASGGIADFGS